MKLLNNVSMSHLIAIAEDDQDISQIIVSNLNANGYKTKSFTNGRELINFSKSIKPDLILLDIMMPICDGIETCKILRNDSKYEDTPIIFLTAKSSESDIVVGHEIGGNDYLVKPFNSNILLSKIRRFLNFKKNESDNVLNFEGITMNIDGHVVTIDNQKISLTTTEFLLLETFIQNKGRVFSRDQLIKRKRIWGDDKIIYDRTIDVHIRNLREKIGTKAILIKSVRGIGYKMDSEE